MPDATDSECTVVSRTGGYKVTRLAPNTLNLKKKISNSRQLAPTSFPLSNQKKIIKRGMSFAKQKPKGTPLKVQP